MADAKLRVSGKMTTRVIRAKPTRLQRLVAAVRRFLPR